MSFINIFYTNSNVVVVAVVLVVVLLNDECNQIAKSDLIRFLNHPSSAYVLVENIARSSVCFARLILHFKTVTLLFFPELIKLWSYLTIEESLTCERN